MIFFDSNIWIYLLSDQDHQKATHIRKLAECSEVIASYQVMNEVCRVMLKRFKRNEQNTKEIIDVFSRLKLHHQSIAISYSALALRERYQFSFWDSLLVATALDAGCSEFYSEDLHHRLHIDALTVLNPFKE